MTGTREAGERIERLLSGADGQVPREMRAAYRLIGRRLYPEMRRETPQGRFSGRLVGALQVKVTAKAVGWTFSKVKLRQRGSGKPHAPRTWQGAPYYYALWRHWGYKDRSRRLATLHHRKRKKLSESHKLFRRQELRRLTNLPWLWVTVKKSEDWIAAVMTKAVDKAIRRAFGSS